MKDKLNRELSWINYNNRILEEGLKPDLPPLERLRFLSIVVSNLDEFFMVRIAALKRALALQSGEAGTVLSFASQNSMQSPLAARDGGEIPSHEESPGAILYKAADLIRPMFIRLYRCFKDEIIPALASGGLEWRRPPFGADETGYLRSLFMREILPALTPLRFGRMTEENTNDEATWTSPQAGMDAGPGKFTSCEATGSTWTSPAIANGILYGAFLLKETGTSTDQYISIVEIPPVLERIIYLEPAGAHIRRWVLLEDLLMLWGAAFFPGYEVQERFMFRILRDADLSVDEDRDDNFVEAMEEVLVNRDSSPAVRMVYTTAAVSGHSGNEHRADSAGTFAASETVIASVSCIAHRMGLENEDIFFIPGPLGLGSLGNLARIQGFDHLKRKIPRPLPHPAFSPDTPVWDAIRSGDILLTLPYQSFDPVIRFFQEAAADPDVISIKTTLYRTSGNSSIVRALEEAALRGKHVTAVVELKARFDEERNISWANRLEKAGVIVIYGLARLKVHAKICQVIRRETGGLQRYIHLSTGNYNDKTARLYSDLSFFTCQENFGSDTTALFNMLSGYSVPLTMSSLVMAPRTLKRRLIELIDREAKRAKEGAPGRIMAKLNALADDDVAAALYRASAAGVKINLNVRGICTLLPGKSGLSENIRVVSIIDQFLEHSRMLYVSNGGAEEFFISSADWMPRNLERRIELLVPMTDEKIREELRDILESYFRDTTNAWVLEENGTWTRCSLAGEIPFRAQGHLRRRVEKAAEQLRKVPEEFIVRRSLGGTSLDTTPPASFTRQENP